MVYARCYPPYQTAERRCQFWNLEDLMKFARTWLLFISLLDPQRATISKAVCMDARCPQESCGFLDGSFSSQERGHRSAVDDISHMRIDGAWPAFLEQFHSLTIKQDTEDVPNFHFTFSFLQK